MSNVLDLKNRVPALPVPSRPVVAEPVVAPEPAPTAPEPVPTTPVDPVTDEDVRLLAEDVLMPSGPARIAWEGHHPLSGSARWRHWMFLGVIVAFGAIISLWQDSLVPFFVMLLGAAALEARERWGKPVSVAIDERGVAVDGTRYDHAAFASFHIHRMPDDTFELSLRSDRRFLPHFRIPLGDQDPHEVHAVLSNYVAEGEHKIPLIDYLIRKP